MTHEDSQDHQPELRPPVAHGYHTRVAAALIGCLVSVGVPAVVLSAPVPMAEERVAGALDDPAGLGRTAALPGDPGSADDLEQAVTSAPVPGWVFGESTGLELPGIPTPELPEGPLGIPGVVLDAYLFAERTLVETRPGCHLSWSMLAGIGRIESNHASDGRVDVFGNTLGPILGPPLDGSANVAAIPDTDHGVLDQDLVWDRAVGPMQFIPSSWRHYGVDGNGDGVANPNNIYDATIASGLYLCAGNADLADPQQLQAAVFRYNHSASYVAIVLQWAQAYLTNVFPTPSAPGPVPPGTNGNGGKPILPDGASLAAAVVQTIPQEPTPIPTPSPTPESPLETPAPLPTATPSATPTQDQPSPTATPSVTPTQDQPSPTPGPSATVTPSPATTPDPPSPTPSPLTPFPDTTSSSPLPEPPTPTPPAPSPTPSPMTTTTPTEPSPVPTPSPSPPSPPAP